MERFLEPYQHDCSECQWAGWLPHFHKAGNLYLHHGTESTLVIVRFSDEPSDYFSSSTLLKKQGIYIYETD